MNNYSYFDAFDETFLGTQIPNYNMNNQNSNNFANLNSSLYGPYEGYVKGNLFRNLYDQYKNYQPSKNNLTPKSEKEEALLNLSQMQFAMHEMNLYLDIYPNDQMMMRNFVNYRNTYNQLLTDYENKYGALFVNSPSLNSVPFGWQEKAWPWDRRDY